MALIQITGGLHFSVIRPTGWLQESGTGLNFSYDFHCAGFYPPVNQEHKNEKQELLETGVRTQVLGVLSALSHPGSFTPRGGVDTQMTTRQIHSHHGQVRATITTTAAVLDAGPMSIHPESHSNESHKRDLGNLRLPHIPGNSCHVKWWMLSPTCPSSVREGHRHLNPVTPKTCFKKKKKAWKSYLFIILVLLNIQVMASIYLSFLFSV